MGSPRRDIATWSLLAWLLLGRVSEIPDLVFAASFLQLCCGRRFEASEVAPARQPVPLRTGSSADMVVHADISSKQHKESWIP